MQWSFSTLGCPEATFDQAIGLAQKYELDAIEIRTLENSMDLADIFTCRFKSPRKASIEYDQLNMQICALGTSCRMITEESEAWQELTALAPWAEALRIPYLRVFDGSTDGDLLTDKDLDKARAFFAWWHAQRSANHWSVDLIVETHSSLITAHSIQQLQDGLERPAQLLWDSHHTWFKGQEDPIRTWHSIKQWVHHIHIKDSPSPTSKQVEVNYTLPGQGDFPFNPFLEQLRKDSFNGVISLEWEKQWHPELPELTAALNACRKTKWWSPKK